MVAPTDALAATTIARRIGLPKRITDVLEGESLVNDASGLLALEFGIAMVMRGQTPSVSGGILRLLFLTVGGLAVGLLVGWIVDWIEHRIDDGPIEIAISILVPYAVYLSANAVRASGVLAVVACGLYLSRRSSGFFSPGVRLQAWAVWDALNFILNGLVFVLIGLQLPYVLAAIHGYKLGQLILYGALFSGLVIALRMAWVFPGAFVAYVVRTHFLHQRMPKPTPQSVIVLGWTGMRGVIALAAAIALPQALDDGSPFPQRSLIVFLAFIVILVTLVLQGLTLPWLVRTLGLANTPGPNLEAEEAQRKIVEAALAYLQQSRASERGEFDNLYEDLIGHYQLRLNELRDPSDGNAGFNPEYSKQFSRISRDLLQLERETAVRLRNENHISDETLREIEHELDLRESGSAHTV